MSSLTAQRWMRNLKVTRRNRPALAFTVLQPVIWMALFAENFKQLANDPTFRDLGYTSYLSFFVPSILVLTVLNASTLSGVSMITDVNAGVLDKYLISPIKRSSILLGRILADGITMVFQCLIVLVIGIVLGARVHTGVAGVVVTIVLVVVLGMCFAALSCFVALHTRNAQLTMIVSGLSTLPLLLLSPAFYPAQLQAGWLRAVEKVNPAAHVVTAGQDLFNLRFDAGQLLITVGVLALTAVLSFTATIREFRRATSAAAGGGGLIRRLQELHERVGVGPVAAPAIPTGAEPTREKIEADSRP